MDIRPGLRDISPVVLMSVPFDVMEKYLGELVLAEERLDFKSGQFVFYKGHQPYGIFVLRKGRIRLCQESGENQEQVLRIVEAGNLFGVEAFQRDQCYEYNAKAETDASVSFFSRVAFS